MTWKFTLICDRCGKQLEIPTRIVFGKFEIRDRQAMDEWWSMGGDVVNDKERAVDQVEVDFCPDCWSLVEAEVTRDNLPA